MCGSVRHRDAATTRNKLRTNKSHLQIVGQNRMNGSVRDASVWFQLHDGHSSIILNQLSHFFNQRNSGNFLTALRSVVGCFKLKVLRQDLKQSEKSRRLVRLHTVLVMSVAGDGGDKPFRKVGKYLPVHIT